jgi:hypothetical protein
MLCRIDQSLNLILTSPAFLVLPSFSSSSSPSAFLPPTHNSKPSQLALNTPYKVQLAASVCRMAIERIHRVLGASHPLSLKLTQVWEGRRGVEGRRCGRGGVVGGQVVWECREEDPP